VESKQLQEAGRRAKSTVSKLVAKERVRGFAVSCWGTQALRGHWFPLQATFGVLVDDFEVRLDKYVSDRQLQWSSDNSAASKRQCTGLSAGGARLCALHRCSTAFRGSRLLRIQNACSPLLAA
jgi:hypothetical protein